MKKPLRYCLLPCVTFLAMLASCATPPGPTVASNERDPCFGVAPAVGTSIVRKADCATGKRQESIAAPASSGVIYDNKLERAGQTGR
jgi:hypothetical protein